jgi:hypothetical protein
MIIVLITYQGLGPKDVPRTHTNQRADSGPLSNGTASETSIFHVANSKQAGRS